MLKKIYEIEFVNQWPYEKDVAVRVADAGQPITLVADDRHGRMHRVYDRFPDRHVSWALLGGFDRFDHALESFAARVGEIWVQTEYALFSSRRQSDDARLDSLRRTLRTDGLDTIPFPPDLRPEAFHIGSYNDAFHTFRHEGSLLRQPYHVLYVSELSDLPIINHRTIPDDVDFAWVNAQVVTYGPCDTLPTYQQLLDRLGRYAQALDAWLAQPVSTAVARKPAERQARSRRRES